MMSDHKYDRLERILMLMIKAGQRGRTRMRELDEKIAILIDAQIRSEEEAREMRRNLDERSQETDRMFQETERRFQETDRKFQETDRKFKETDREFKEVARRFRETDDLFRRSDAKFAKLAESQERTDRKLETLIDQVENG
ncbi:MAG TPA: hypothetical protein VGQ39_09545 [Pyrinomonadaceae bacterium]|jgi:DNA repair ATPase RecN|nr:hypothetical protein [Pyrinomonadaceae bacterium]